MPIVNVYDKFGEHLEENHITGSLNEWIKDTCPSFKDSVRPPHSAKLNGKTWPHSDHCRVLLENDVVDLTIEPKDPIDVVLIILAVVSAAYSYYQVKKLGNPYQETVEPGKSIYTPGGRANSAVPSGVIREVAGQIQIFPDLICPPRRQFENNEEFLYLMLSVCRGNISMAGSNVYIAETPTSNYAGDITINIFEPGDDVSGAEASENWFESREISNLTLTTASSTKFGVWTLDAAGANFTSYLNGVASAFPYAVGERFILAGSSNPGLYEVTAISGSSSEIGTVDEMVYIGGTQVRLEVVTYQIAQVTAPPQRLMTNLGAATLVGVTGESITSWGGIGNGVAWEGPFSVAPAGETTSAAEIDVFFPQGLGAIDGSNNLTNTTVEIAIEYRDVGDSTWITVGSTSWTDDTYDQLGFTITLSFSPAISPEFRFRRITSDSEDIGTSDIVQIKRVRVKLETPTSYPDITTMALKIRGTNALAASAENRINIRGATRKLPTLAELEADSWDLSNAATQTAGGYVLTGAEQLSSTQITQIGDTPEVAADQLGIDFRTDGLKMLIYDNSFV